jgi:hypothetical protein
MLKPYPRLEKGYHLGGQFATLGANIQAFINIMM